MAEAAALDGVIVVAKEPGPTSHDIVGLVRRLTGVRRVGHGGTLDPFAAGVLPVFVGRATRLVEYHLGDFKEYRAVVAFGARSTTDDLSGELTTNSTPAPSRRDVEADLGAFRGRIDQTPPDYSAVRVAGRKAYELARHGRKPELRPRTVTIERLELVDWDDSAPDRPTATLDIRCSAGTYVRALARDLGERLGGGAYLVALTRTASGPFLLAGAHTVGDVRRALAEGRPRDVLLPPDTGLDELPQLQLGETELRALAKGQPVRPADPLGGELPVRVFDQRGRLVAIGRAQDGWLQPEKVFLGRSD